MAVAVVGEGLFGDEDGVGLGFYDDAGVDGHSGAERADVFEGDGDFDHSGAGFDDGGDAVDVGFEGVVGEGVGDDSDLLADFQGAEFFFRDEEAGDDGVEVDDVEEVLSVGDFVAKFEESSGDGSGDGGADFGVAEFSFGVF